MLYNSFILNAIIAIIASVITAILLKRLVRLFIILQIKIIKYRGKNEIKR